MNASLLLRLMTRADLPFADSVRAVAGWNQTIADWERFLAAAPDGCFVAECNGVPVGTATTITYSPALAWIGMVLVHPDFRRRGVGRALLEHCINHLFSHGVRCIKLDATPAGKEGIRSWRDLDAVEPFDAAAFGVSRRVVLEPLMRSNRGAVMVEGEPGQVAGYGLLREGSSALYLGPVVAASAHAGTQLVDALLAQSGEGKVYWDVPDQNTAAVECARERDFAPLRTLTRMYLGQNAAAGDLPRLFAIAGPELG